MAFAGQDVVEVVVVNRLHVEIGDLVPVAFWLGGTIYTKVVAVSLWHLKMLIERRMLLNLYAILFQLEW